VRVRHRIEIRDVVRGHEHRSAFGDPIEVLESPAEPQLEGGQPDDLGDAERGLQSCLLPRVRGLSLALAAPGG
jgi:hypothetical protein